jgi:hypothetical protein
MDTSKLRVDIVCLQRSGKPMLDITIGILVKQMMSIDASSTLCNFTGLRTRIEITDMKDDVRMDGWM